MIQILCAHVTGLNTETKATGRKYPDTFWQVEQETCNFKRNINMPWGYFWFLKNISFHNLKPAFCFVPFCITAQALLQSSEWIKSFNVPWLSSAWLPIIMKSFRFGLWGWKRKDYLKLQQPWESVVSNFVAVTVDLKERICA